MALLGGVVTRPEGSDGFWPPIGTKVAWSAAQPIEDLMEQDLKYSQFSNLGVIGNLSHLQKHGGHTPWRPGSQRGKVYAKDTKTLPEFKAFLLRCCRSDYDTSWMRFFNLDNGQYDSAGNYLGYSADGHFHCEVQNGHENTNVTLFDDFAEEMGYNMPSADEIAQAVVDKVVASTAIGPQSVGQLLKWAAGAKDTGKVLDAIVALTAKVDRIPEAIRASVSAMEINMTEEQLAKFIAGVTERINQPRSGTWTTNPEA